MKSNDLGTDYGDGRCNMNPTTGIRYGVIPPDEVAQAWYDSVEYDGHIYTLNDSEEGYIAAQAEDRNIFIVKSKYYTYAQFCSPCAPGAGYLMEPREGGVKTYCFDHDWFYPGIAPYPVYRVDDDSPVYSLCRYHVADVSNLSLYLCGEHLVKRRENNHLDIVEQVSITLPEHACVDCKQEGR